MIELLQEMEEVRKAAASTKEELNSHRQHNEKLQEDLQVKEVSVSKLREELHEMRKNVDSTKEELSKNRLHNEKLQEELQGRELSISKLREELQEVRTALMKTTESGPPSPSPSPQPVTSASSSSTTQPKRKEGKQPASKGSSAKDKTALSRKNSAASSQSSNRSQSSRANSTSEQQHVTVMDSFTQTEPLQMSDLSPESKSASKKEMEEVIGEFQEKIVQMQELHAAEILDMESRHISESEILRRDTQALEDECKALKAVIDKLRSTEVRLWNKKKHVWLDVNIPTAVDFLLAAVFLITSETICFRLLCPDKTAQHPSLKMATSVVRHNANNCYSDLSSLEKVWKTQTKVKPSLN